MWDNDTMEMETKQFPGTLELITGDFLRHSPEYHQWRIQDRAHKRTKYPDSLELYDDLAVSYSKLGADSTAIVWMLKSDSMMPNRYETIANLGTFYIHAGDLETGKRYIEKAIQINPKAHFGREMIQLELVNYILKQRERGSIGLPLSVRTPSWHYGSYHNNPEKGQNFYHHLKNAGISKEAGIKGLEGMMRFGNYNAPILLEALGDLLVGTNNEEDESEPRHLIRWAYESAATSGDQKKWAKKIEIATEAMPSSRRFRKKGEKMYATAQRKAELHYNNIRDNERLWIMSGQNVDSLFKAVYFDVDPEDRFTNYINPKLEEYRDFFQMDSTDQVRTFQTKLEQLMASQSLKVQNNSKVASQQGEEEPQMNQVLKKAFQKDPTIWYLLVLAVILGVGFTALRLFWRRKR